MIPLEKQVISLEYAKQLKDLGVRQESLWYWRVDIDYGNTFLELSSKISVDTMLAKLKSGKNYKYYSAFTVAELGEMLNQHWRIGFHPHYSIDHWRSTYKNCNIQADTEANARAKMLIYLIEQGIIKAEDI